MNKVLEKYYNIFRHLKSCENIVKDINFLEYYSEHLDENAYLIEDEFVEAYENSINKVGKFYQNRYATFDFDLLISKNFEDIYNDLQFIINCIIIDKSVELKLSNSINDIVKEIEENGN